MSVEDPSLLLDALSTRVLRHLSPVAWRNLFLRPHGEVMRFAPGRGTLLYAAAQMPAWSDGAELQPELAFLATAHGGELDDCPAAAVLVRFDDALAALDMALEMQQLAGPARFQVGLATGECSVATLHLEERLLRAFVGGAAERAESVARLAAPGSIRLSAETYACVQDAVGSVASWMLATEFESDILTAATLTPPPRPTSALSTFAGLGLT